MEQYDRRSLSLFEYGEGRQRSGEIEQTAGHVPIGAEPGRRAPFHC
jgi:hypothetical protein